MLQNHAKNITSPPELTWPATERARSNPFPASARNRRTSGCPSSRRADEAEERKTQSPRRRQRGEPREGHEPRAATAVKTTPCEVRPPTPRCWAAVAETGCVTEADAERVNRGDGDHGAGEE
jgi:hypothetical protein